MILLVGAGIQLAHPSAAGYARRQDGCGDPATGIHVLQGTGERTPEGGKVHTVEGVVVGDYQDPLTEFNGFFIQEEDGDADADPATSEGIFIDGSLVKLDVNAGDVVRVTGTAFELSSDGVSLTQLRRVQSITVCDSGATVTPAPVTLPVEDLSAWERVEGMLVTLDQELTVSDTYNLGRYGEIKLAANGRLFNPTQAGLPGSEAQAIMAVNALRTIILDDGNSQQNRDPVAYPPPGLSAGNTVRAGDVLMRLTGVLDQSAGAYRIHPIEPLEFIPANPRPAAPPTGDRHLRIASFNVLNYFNGEGFPTLRGANTPEEFERQRSKIISALVAIDADIVGLIEIENDGDGPDSAIADLVEGLNAALGEGTYAAVPDPVGLATFDNGGDEIKVGIVYRPGTVRALGAPMTTLDPPFGGRRPPVAQAFEVTASGEQLVVVTNHFKSKGCQDAGVDPDRGDGQGCWNNERVQAAETLMAWLATDPTGAGDPDALILGDLNAYAREDPIRAFESAGFVDLARQFGGEAVYSYIYMGEVGTLDYALGNAAMASQVTGATIWHINADEPRALDYNMEYKSERQIARFFSPDPYRSSDHDPVVVDLALGGSGTSDGAAGQAAEAQTDSMPGQIAILAGIAAVVLAMIAGWVVERARRK